MFVTVSSLLRWAVGLMYSLMVMTLLTLLSYFVPLRRIHGLIRVLFRSMLWVFGLRVEMEGLENLDPGRGYVYMSNHVNLFEPFIVAAFAPHWVVAIEKMENFKVPVYGQLIRRWGNIPIDRGDTRSAMQSLDQAKGAIAQGFAVQLMPEGTRTRTGALGPFKKGGFHMAIDAGAPIAPYAFRGMFNYNRTGTWKLVPTTVRVIFKPTIETSAYTKEQLPELMERVRAEIQEALEPSPQPTVTEAPAPHAAI